MVFPRTVVKLNMHGKEPLIGSPNVAVFYNKDTYYERSKLSEDGDQCEFFQYSPALLREILAAHAPQHDTTTFPFTYTFLNRTNFVLQRALVDKLFNAPFSDELFVDETAVQLLEQVIIDSFAQRGQQKRQKQTTHRAHSALAHDTQLLLATHFDQPLSLQKLANQLFVSPYHLSRVFRQQTGCTLHHFLEQIRLRSAYERIGDYKNNLSQLALDVGYSTHSHFSDAFQRNFGFSPSHSHHTSLC